MKKLLSLAAVALMALGAQADDVKYLNFRTIDGKETSVSIENGLTITFENGKIIAKADGTIFQADLSEMQDMYFGATLVGIQNIASDAIPAGTLVRVYTTDGRMVQSYEQTAGAQPALPAGLYMIQAGGKTTKTLVK